MFAEVEDRPEKEESLRGLRPTALAVVILAIGVGACGGDDQPERGHADERAAQATEPTNAGSGEGSEAESAEPGGKSTETGGAALARRPAGEDGLRSRIAAVPDPLSLAPG